MRTFCITHETQIALFIAFLVGAAFLSAREVWRARSSGWMVVNRPWSRMERVDRRSRPKMFAYVLATNALAAAFLAVAALMLLGQVAR